MRRYRVILIAIIMLIPTVDVRASEATMVASLSIAAVPMPEAQSAAIRIMVRGSEKLVPIMWGGPESAVTVSDAAGYEHAYALSSGATVELTTVQSDFQLSIY